MAANGVFNFMYNFLILIYRVLTGTSIQNSLEDLYSLFLYLRFEPYDDYERFRTSIFNCLSLPDLSVAFKIIHVCL